MEINEVSAGSLPKLQVWPNPSGTQFNLRSSQNGSHQPLRIRVVDINGRQVFAATGNAETIYRFGENLAPGLYIVETEQGCIRSSHQGCETVAEECSPAGRELSPVICSGHWAFPETTETESSRSRGNFASAAFYRYCLLPQWLKTYRYFPDCSTIAHDWLMIKNARQFAAKAEQSLQKGGPTKYDGASGNHLQKSYQAINLWQ
jgi:hypothetical protein